MPSDLADRIFLGSEPGDLVITQPEIWPNPQSLPDGQPPVPEFTEALLPNALRPWVVDIADRMQCPPDFLAAGVIIALSGAVGRRSSIQPKRQDDWTIVPNLWGGVVGRPGLMKTPALDEVMRPLKKLEAEAAAEYRKAIEEHEASKRISAAMKTEIDKEIRKAVKDGYDATTVLQKYEVVEPPQHKRFIVPDATMEALGEILQINENGVLVYRDELMGLLSSLDREGREDARAFYLESWNGFGSFCSDRIGRGHIFIPNVCVSILGGIQPGKLEPYVRHATKGGSGDDGLLQRFQVLVWPDHPRDWKNIDRLPDTNAKDIAHSIYTRLATMTPESEARRFDPAAQELFTEWRIDLENRLRSGSMHAALESHIAKYRKLMPALSLLLSLADGDDGDIGIDHAERSAAWCEYLEAHANRIYSVATNTDAVIAKFIAQKIKSGALTETFTASNVYRPKWSGLTDRKEIQAGLDLLEDLDWVSCDVEQHAGGGRPKKVYHVNPKVRGNK